MRKTIAILAGITLTLSVAQAAVAAPAPAAPSGRLLVMDPTGNTDDYTADLFSVHPDGTDEQNLNLNLVSYAYPDYSPDGTKIVYIASHCCFAIDIANSDGTGATELTESGYAPSHPRWSPRGDLIAFEGGGIWTVTAQAPHEVNPVTDTGMLVGLSAEWAPTGRMVAVAVYGDSPNIWLYPVPGDVTKARQLTHETGFAPDAMTWSPDGSTIITESNGDLYKVSPKSGRVTDITNTPDVTETSPVYSPDGSWIAYAAQPADASSLPAVQLMNARTLTSHATGTVGTPTSWRSQP